MSGKKLYFQILFLLVFSAIPALLLSQQKPIFSQYMFNELAINPAYAGTDKWFNATVLYRNQWVNLEGSPTTGTFNIHSGIGTTKVGLGLLVYSDKVGIHEDIGFYGSYAYHIKLPGGVLSLGLQAGFNRLESDFNKLNLRNPGDPSLSGIRSIVNPNFGAGVLFTGKKYFVSFSAPFLLNNKIVDIDEIISEATEKRNYFLYGGGIFDLGPNFKLKPSVLFRMQEGNPVSFDINTLLIVKERLSFGVSYRNIDALIFLFEFGINQYLHIGYAYDTAG